MANPHSTSDFTIAGTEHNVIVRYRPNQGDASTPSITLSGKWLRDAGFDTGQHILVKVMNGCIVLVKYSDKEEWLAAALDKTRKQLREVKAVMKNAYLQSKPD
ncbi:SymE family type I addiction module toxin [Enterobacter sp. Bisph1]|uniref:SymE family type I addiction module toxin n=1 Tax=Enterobacter sp. Bisph1 TaxID=1274399 RepID=UPI00057BD265|nr:SymE family type I addiction module toxin [Enterobacter sp. Bisph1]